jgi:hypothetical protein
MPSSNPIDVEPLQGGLARSRALRQWSAWRAKRAEEVRHESRQLRVHAQALLERSQQLRQRYLLAVPARRRGAGGHESQYLPVLLCARVA